MFLFVKRLFNIHEFDLFESIGLQEQSIQTKCRFTLFLRDRKSIEKKNKIKRNTLQMLKTTKQQRHETADDDHRIKQ